MTPSMTNTPIERCSQLLKETEKVLRKLEKAAKIVTQHVQTSIFAATYQAPESQSFTSFK